MVQIFVLEKGDIFFLLSCFGGHTAWCRFIGGRRNGLFSAALLIIQEGRVYFST